MPTESTERRRRSRTPVSKVVSIRPIDSRLHPDSGTTLNVSQDGIYLATLADHYTPGVNVYVTDNFQPGSLTHFPTAGIVVRVEKLEDAKWGVAIHVFSQASSN